VLQRGRKHHAKDLSILSASRRVARRKLDRLTVVGLVAPPQMHRSFAQKPRSGWQGVEGALRLPSLITCCYVTACSVRMASGTFPSRALLRLSPHC